MNILQFLQTNIDLIFNDHVVFLSYHLDHVLLHPLHYLLQLLQLVILIDLWRKLHLLGTFYFIFFFRITYFFLNLNTGTFLFRIFILYLYQGFPLSWRIATFLTVNSHDKALFLLMKRISIQQLFNCWLLYLNEFLD